MKDAYEQPIFGPIVELGPRTLRIGEDKMLVRSSVRSIEIVHEVVPAIREMDDPGRCLWAAPIPRLASLVTAGLGLWFAYTAITADTPLWLLLPFTAAAMIVGYWASQIYEPPRTDVIEYERDTYAVAFFDASGDVVRLHAESRASAMAFFQQITSAWNLDLQNDDRVEISQNGIENKMLRSLKAYDEGKGKRRVVLYDSNNMIDHRPVIEGQPFDRG